MSSMDKSGVPGTMYLTMGPTDLGTGVTGAKLGAAAITCPAGMDILLGIWAHMSPVAVTADNAQNAWGFLDSDDGINIKPFEFLFPNSGCADATPSMSNSNPGIYYPVNCRLTPGARIECHAYNYEAVTDGPWASITYWFGRVRDTPLQAPKFLDDHPLRQRWRVVGRTETASIPYSYAPEVQYQFTLGAQGGQITELGALVWTTTAGAGEAPDIPAGSGGGAIVQFNSPDVPIWPSEISVNAYGAKLGATGGHVGSDGVTRRFCSAPGEKVIHLDAEYIMIPELNANATGTNQMMVTMVEFVRTGE